MGQPPLGSVPGMFVVRDGPSANLGDPILSHEHRLEGDNHQGPANHVYPSQGNRCDVGMRNMDSP